MVSYDMSYGFFIIFVILFASVFGLIIVMAVRGIIQWGKNNNSPKIPAEAKIVAKRLNVGGGGINNSMSSTSYYATFEFSTGDRKEFRVPFGEYGLLAEGDAGILTFQGTRYISFERKIQI